MKVRKIGRGEICVLISAEEAGKGDLTALCDLAERAFSSLSEASPKAMEITVFAKDDKLLFFARKKESPVTLTSQRLLKHIKN